MRYWIPVAPVVKMRPRLGRRRKAFTPEKTVNYENALRAWWQTHNASVRYEGPIYVGVEIHKEGIQVEIIELEQSVRPVGVLGDLDNYQKSVWDGLQDAGELLGAFANDKQVEWAEIKFVGIPRPPKKETT